MSLHPVVETIMRSMAESNLPAFWKLSPQQARTLVAQMRAASPVVRVPEMGAIEDIVLPGPRGEIESRLYRPQHCRNGVLVYLHGGGWVLGDLDTHHEVAATLADASGLSVLNVAYRLAPEHVFPQPLDDAYAALCWAAVNYPGPVFVGGDSAGGNLAAACALRARDEAGPSVAAQLLIYPVTDHDFTTASYRDNGELGYVITTRDMAWFWDHYAPPSVDRNNPLLSPLRAAKLSGLPPAYVVIANYDPLRDEGLAYAGRLQAAGNEVMLQVYPDMVHGFVGLVGLVDTAEAALREMGLWLAAKAQYKSAR